MNDLELDQRLNAIASISDQRLATLDLGDGETQLLEAIMASNTSTTAMFAGNNAEAIKGSQPKSLQRWRRSGVRLLASIAAATTLLLGFGSFGNRGSSAYAAEIVAIAQANERLLLDLPGWSVTRADEFSIDRGEMKFSNGQDVVDLNWLPATTESYQQDRRNVTDPSDIVFRDRPATLFRYTATDIAIFTEPRNGTMIQIRGDLGSEDSFRSMLAAFRQVSVERWLDAMPESVVKPADRTTIVRDMLIGLPIPDGVDVNTIARGDGAADRGMLGSKVTGTISCAWFNQYLNAVASGDTSKADEARAALKSSRQWPILVELNNDGEWSNVIWSLVDRLDSTTQPLTKQDIEFSVCAFAD